MRLANKVYIAEFPSLRPGIENLDSNLVARLGAGLGHRLYVGSDNRLVKPVRVRLSERDRKMVAVSRLRLPDSDVPQEWRLRRIKPEEWAERGARRAEPVSVADHCVLALGDLGLYDREAEVFRTGEGEVGLTDFRDAISALPELSADPPVFSGPGCAEDLVTVTTGVFRVTNELLGRPAGVVCELDFLPASDFAPPPPEGA